MPVHKIAVVADYLEEGWPSMDRVADGVTQGFQSLTPPAFKATLVRPEFLSPMGSKLSLSTRLLNRFLNYPRALKQMASQFDLFHITDQSYAHLALYLPKGRVGIQVHDLDFLKPSSHFQSWKGFLYSPFSYLLRKGLRRAALVFADSQSTRQGLLQQKLTQVPDVTLAPLGISPEYLESPIERSTTTPNHYLLHVGSCVERKDLPTLLKAFANIIKSHSTLTLIQIGGTWNSEQLQLIKQLGLQNLIVQKQGISNRELAALYRDARLVALPSRAEGFGLPVVEALACGAPLIYSDLPVLNEVAGSHGRRVQPGNIADWTEGLEKELKMPDSTSLRLERRQWAKQFSWNAHCQVLARHYSTLIDSKLIGATHS